MGCQGTLVVPRQKQYIWGSQPGFLGIPFTFGNDIADFIIGQSDVVVIFCGHEFLQWRYLDGIYGKILAGRCFDPSINYFWINLPWNTEKCCRSNPECRYF